MKHIFIAGGSGYIGAYLSQFFLDGGHQVTATGTRRHHPLQFRDNFSYISTDTSRSGAWQEALRDCQVVINLTGKTIFRHWTDKYKKQIHNSRVATTQHIVAALPKKTPILFCSASAVGYYGDGKDQILTESSPVGKDFLSQISKDWEAAAAAAESEHVRVVIARFGIILDRNGGAMAKMIPAFKLFAGGKLGDGRQWFPWMHMQDLASAMQFIMETPAIHGAVNFCSPHPVRNRELTRKLARALSRPAMFNVPSFALRLFLGEFGETLLVSQRVVPEKLIQHGFSFKFNQIEGAIAEMVSATEDH